MPVPNTFANATATIPLSQLDANFATTITLGNTAIQLGNTVSTLNNMTLANVTVTSGNVTITNVTVTTANVTTANIATAQIANVTVSGTSTFAAGSNTAPSITFSGDTNTGIYSPGADQVAIATGGSKRFEVDAVGNAGLGVTPSGWTLGKAIEVGTSPGNGIWGVGASNMNIVSNVYYDGAYKFAGTGSAGTLSMSGGGFAFASSTASGTAGGTISFTDILGASRGNTLYLQGASAQAGTGITFPATQSASTNANTLDDYEEGTFTATLSPGTSGSITLNSIYDLLSYTKIGRLVTITGQLVVSSVSSPVGSLVNLNNLPFPCADTGELSERAGGCTTYVDNSANAYYTQGMLLAAGDTFTRILMSEAGRVAAIAADDGFVFSFSYITST